MSSGVEVVKIISISDWVLLNKVKPGTIIS